MAVNNFRFNLDIEREDYLQKFKVKQYDTAIFYVNLFKNSTPFQISNETIKMFVKKSDGTILYQEDGITIENGVIKINVKNQALTAPGLTYAELELKSNTGQVTTATFIFEVREKVGSDNAIKSVTDIATLEKVTKYVEDAKKELDKFKKDLAPLEDLVANKDKLKIQNEEAKVNITELGKVLEDANNIVSDEGKKVIGNNIVSESTNGYVQDIKLSGKSLVNHLKTTDLNTTNITKVGVSKYKISYSSYYTNMYHKGITTLQNNKVYTCIYNYKIISGTVSKPPFVQLGYTDANNSGYIKDILVDKWYSDKSEFSMFTFTPKELTNSNGINVRLFRVTDSGVPMIIEGEVIILEGDHTQNPPNGCFEGLKSVGDGVDEIVVSSTNNGNILDKNTIVKGGYLSRLTGNVTIEANSFYTDYFIEVSPGMKISTNSIGIFTYYDSQKLFISGEELTKGLFTNIPINCKYMKISFYNRLNIIDTLFVGHDVNNPSFTQYKQDKKQLLYYYPQDKTWKKPVLREWDTVEKHSDGKYYYHNRSQLCNYISNTIVYQSGNDKENTLLYYISLSNIGNNVDSTKPIISNLFTLKTYQEVIPGDEEGMVFNSQYNVLYIRISKSKGTTQSEINAYLKENNLQLLVHKQQEEIFECLDISVRSFRNKTMLSINSGAIDPGVEYYLPVSFVAADNSISEKVEILDEYIENNIKDINDLNFNMEQNYFNINRGILSDFNNGIQEGKYYLHSTSLIPNSPPTSQTSLYGIVQVFYKNYNELFQIVALHNSELWIRFRNGHDQWNPWSKILNSQDFETQHGSNGFLKFPNGSALLFGSGVTNNGVLRINFKLTFAKSDDIVLTGSALDPSPQTVGFRNLTTTGCELTCSWAANPVGVKWFAFGKIQ